MMTAQVKSRERVSEHGEVYTNKREVDAMLDLVKSETERIDSRFLEPACGHGNFLVEILERKLNEVERKYGKSQIEFERYGVLAVACIYGIDLLPDNIKEARERLLDIFNGRYSKLFLQKTKSEVVDVVRFLLSKNLIVGNALDLTTIDGQPIVFSEFSPVSGDIIKRRDYSFGHLINRIGGDGPLFSDLGDEAFIPNPEEPDFPAVSYLKLPYVDNDAV